MLYPYKYLENQDIEKLHKYIMFFFETLFSEPAHFDDTIHDDFKDLAKHYEESLFKPLKDIYQKYITLDADSKEKIKTAVKANNSIKELCECLTNPVNYEEINEKIREDIGTLCANLWSALTKNYPEIHKHCGKVTEHFHCFVSLSHQEAILCPFCGLEELLSEFDAEDVEDDTAKRDDYDHYIPKNKYPFNSINFKNLVPMGDKCNKKYKNQKDTPYRNPETKERRKVFFPFDASLKGNHIVISIVGNQDDLNNSDDWELEIKDILGKTDEINSWNEIFAIKRRYKARIKKYERIWKKNILKKHKREKNNGIFNQEKFKEEIFEDIDILTQVNGIVQKAYYEYFFNHFSFFEN